MNLGLRLAENVERTAAPARLTTFGKNHYDRDFTPTLWAVIAITSANRSESKTTLGILSGEVR
jgi:hypothetical protein